MAANRVPSNRPAPVPKEWREVKLVDAEIKKIQSQEIDASLRLTSGRTISLPTDAIDKDVGELVKKGYLKLYRNDRDEPGEGESGPDWIKADYFVAQPKMGELDTELEKHLAKAERISKAANTELARMHKVMHGSRALHAKPGEQPKIEAEVAAEIPKARDAIIKYEQDVGKFNYDTQLLPYPDGEHDLSVLGDAVIKEGAPHLEGGHSLSDLSFTKDLLRANEMLLPRPEVNAVDPGEGIRINVDTDLIVRGGGDFNQWKKDVTKQLRDAFITGHLDFDQDHVEDQSTRAAQELLAKAMGQDKVIMDSEGWTNGDDGETVTLYVAKGSLDEAKSHLPELRELFHRYGYDMKRFEIELLNEE